MLGVKCRGRNVAAGERIPIDAPVSLVVGNSDIDGSMDEDGFDEWDDSDSLDISINTEEEEW